MIGRRSLLHELAVVNFVFNVERSLFLAILPVFFGDQAIDLVEAFGGARVRAEVAGEALDG